MNRGLIVIAGMSRGGTNLLWNIVQSHPDVIDTFYELNQIFSHKTDISLIHKVMVEMEALGHIPVPGVRQIVKQRLVRFAKKSFQEDRFNREKYPGKLYEQDEFDSINICTKLVSAWETDLLRQILRRNDALKYIPLLERTFSDIKIVFLIRNGLAVAEGWGRRGADIETAARWYSRYVVGYETYIKHHRDNTMILRFEDLLSNPFATAEEIYRKLGFNNTSLDHLRIAIKPTINTNRDLTNTTEKNKIWIDRGNWKDHLDVTINDSQIERLTIENRQQFIDFNSGIMLRYGYL